MKIKVYSTPTCAYCHTLKDFLKEHNIDFEDVDISQDQLKREEMIKKTQQMEVPVIDIDGQIIIGFNKEKIVKILNIKD